jgi:hypothetical protein
LKKLKNFNSFSSEIAIYLSIDLHKGRPATEEACSPQVKREHSALQNMKFLFPIFVGHYYPSGS